MGQDVSTLANEVFPVLNKPVNRIAGPRLLFRFLCSPKEIQAGPGGRIHSLTLTENILVRADGRVAAKATDETAKIDVDTVIFAIGDVHDATLGIPTGATGYVTRDSADPKQTRFTRVLTGYFFIRLASNGFRHSRTAFASVMRGLTNPHSPRLSGLLAYDRAHRPQGCSAGW